MTRTITALACFVLAGLTFAQEASISGPDDIVPIGKSVWLEVEGVSVSELQAGSVKVFPTGYDVEIRTLQDLSGTILIWFEASEANAMNQYDVLVIAPYMDGDSAAVKELQWTIMTGDPPPPVVVPPVVPPTEDLTKVTYIYEKDDNSVPRPVAGALHKLNATGVVATEFEEDSTDGLGEVPDQYKIALKAAREEGLPAAVFQAGDVILKVVHDPQTEADILEALK